ITTAHVLQQFDHHLAVGESADDASAETDVHMPDDGLGELRVGASGEDPHPLERHRRRLWKTQAGRPTGGPARRVGGWGGRDRTYECRNQNPVPYHLATPQGKPFARGNIINVRQTTTAGGGSAREQQIRPFLRRFHRRFHRCLLSRAAPARALAARRIRKRKRRKRTLPIRSSALPTLAPRATARQDSRRSPGTARTQPLAGRYGHIPRKRRPFSRTGCVVSIREQRTWPWSRPRSAATTRRTRFAAG